MTLLLEQWLQQKAKEVKRVSQGAENFIKGPYVVQESNTGRKADCSKSNMSRYFVTVFFLVL